MRRVAQAAMAEEWPRRPYQPSAILASPESRFAALAAYPGVVPHCRTSCRVGRSAMHHAPPECPWCEERWFLRERSRTWKARAGRSTRRSPGKPHANGLYFKCRGAEEHSNGNRSGDARVRHWSATPLTLRIRAFIGD